MDRHDSPISRRAVLAGTGGVAAVGLAGCLGGGDPDGGSGDGGDAATGTPAAEQQLPHPVAGGDDPPVTVSAFEDFACSHCATYSLEVVPQIREEYVATGDVRYRWFDYPLPVNERHSWLAADAARSVYADAEESDATFFEFAHAVFENQGSLSLDLYEELANDVGVDGATVREETEDRRYEPTVRASKRTGRDRGVSRTPTVFVGDEKLVGPTFEDLSGAIDAALER